MRINLTDIFSLRIRLQYEVERCLDRCTVFGLCRPEIVPQLVTQFRIGLSYALVSWSHMARIDHLLLEPPG